MNTNAAIIIMAGCLIILMLFALFLIYKYMKRFAEVQCREDKVSKKEEELNLFEKMLRKRKNDLGLTMVQMCRQIRTEIPTKHVKVSITSDIPSKGKGYIPRHEYKQMASRLGYKLLANVKNHVTAEKQDDKTIYTVDVEYVQ